MCEKQYKEPSLQMALEIPSESLLPLFFTLCLKISNVQVLHTFDFVLQFSHQRICGISGRAAESSAHLMRGTLAPICIMSSGLFRA